MLRSAKLSICLCAALLAGSSARAQNAEADPTALALRASLLGDASAVEALARAVPPEQKDLAAAMGTLAAATRQPMADESALRAAVPARRRLPLVRTLRLLIVRNEPETMLKEARADRRFEQQRRAYNTLVGPFWGAAQGQFFGLVTLPLQALDHLFIGRRFLNPEQRRELALANEYPDATGADRIPDSWPERRLRLTQLQARSNAELALRNDAPLTASWWLEREASLTESEAGPEPSKVRERTSQLAMQVDSQKKTSVSVIDDRTTLNGPTVQAETATLLRGFVVPEGDDGRFWRALNTLRGDERLAWIRDELRVLELSMELRAGRAALARAAMENLADEFPNEPWGWRSAHLMQRPQWGPEQAMDRARADLTDRRWRFITRGESLQPLPLSLTQEEARLARGFFYERLRALFIFDSLSRLLIWPLLPSARRPLYSDLYVQTPEDWRNHPDNREWARRTARAYEVDRRYEQSVPLYVEAGDVARSLKSVRKGARYLEREAENSSPERAVRLYERALDLAPAYKHRGRVESALAWTLAEADALVRIDRKFLRRYREEIIAAPIPLPASLIDGKRSNGEVTREGVLVESDALAWRRSRISAVERIALGEGERTQVLRSLEPLLRADRTGQILSEPRARKRIPLAVEAGALPGFDVAPGLVPLDPDRKQRRYYE